MQRVKQLASLLFQRRAFAIQLRINAAQLIQLGVQLRQLLFRFLDLAAAGKQTGHARLHAAAGHRTAGVHHVALKRHQPQLIA